MPLIPAVDDQLLALKVCAGIEELPREDRFAAADADLVDAIVQGIAALAGDQWAALNRIGDAEGARLADGVVSLPEGFAGAYDAYVEQGWNGIAAPAEFGGQGLPFSLACNVLENLGTANLAFSLLPMLTLGAIEALDRHGSENQKRSWLPKLITGEWAGTMNLTEPQAGSDVGALRTSAAPIAEGEHAGKYRISGQKIFITWGEHHLAENIVHLVLARMPGAPAGSRGISMFLVPKFLLNPDGTPGPRNDLHCASLEHKLGIHASPTCVMVYGDQGACIGELIGKENEGLRAMFTMMNQARINVGSQGVQISERATQMAATYAQERIQSARADAPDRTPVPIIEHPDVRRMILRMKALTEGARALLYYTAGQVDRASTGDQAAGKRADLLVPLLKSWATDTGVEVSSLGIQVHGGMGFIEEAGAAQLYRDARIAPIYEGTNGIQAADLVTRKLPMDGGQVFAALMAEIADEAADAPTLRQLAHTCSEIGEWMLQASLDDRLAGSVPFCTMCAVAVAGWQLLRQRRAVDDGAAPVLAALKPATSAFFLGHVVPEAMGLASAARAGAQLLYSLDASQMGG